MNLARKRALIVALVIAAVGLAACVVRTAPAHRHQPAYEKHEHKKHKKHKKPKKHKDH